MNLINIWSENNRILKNDVYLIISDIHSDIKALNAIIDIIYNLNFKRKYGVVNKIINLGDTLERGYNPDDVIKRLKELGNEISLVSIIGNHDESILNNWPLSGSDYESISRHDELKSNGNFQKICLDFLTNLPQYYVNNEERIFAVHGGPLEPEMIAPPNLGNYDKWLYQRAWQRISEYNYEYLDNYGYHYLPESAFYYVRKYFDNGFIIFCGHQHIEAAYMNKDMKTKNILENMKVRTENIAGHKIKIRELERKQNINYLFRIGIAGPAGYYKKYHWNTTHYGLLWNEKGTQKVGLFQTELDYE